MKILIKFIIFITKLIFKIEVEGLENIPDRQKLLICVNHISYWDPVIIYIVMPYKCYFMAKKELFTNKCLAYIFNELGAIPIDRDKTSLKSIKLFMNILEEGNPLCIFPEGTRINDEKESNPKNGIALIADKTDALILPIKIDTKYKIFGKVTVKIGKSFKYFEHDSNNDKKTNYNFLTSYIMNEINKL